MFAVLRAHHVQHHLEVLSKKLQTNAIMCHSPYCNHVIKRTSLTHQRRNVHQNFFLAVPECPFHFIRRTRSTAFLRVRIEDEAEQLAAETRWRAQALDKMSWEIFAEDLLREMALPHSCTFYAPSMPHLQARPKDVAANFLHMFVKSLHEGQLCFGCLGGCRHRVEAQDKVAPFSRTSNRSRKCCRRPALPQTHWYRSAWQTLVRTVVTSPCEPRRRICLSRCSLLWRVAPERHNL